MKIRWALSMFVACALPQFGHAAVPITAQALGALQGVVDFCVRVDPRDSNKFRDVVEQSVHAMPEQELVSLRKSSEYKQVYEMVHSLLVDDVPSAEAARRCAGAVEEPIGHGQEGERKEDKGRGG